MAVVLIAIVVAMVISSFVTNEKWNFPFAFEIMQQTPVIEGLWKGTIFGTVGAMVLGIGLGVVLAVMRLSSNPVLRGVAFVYTWFFRAIPRYVLLVLLGTGIGFLYPVFDIGLPFGQQIADVLGLDRDAHVPHARLQQHLEHHLGRHPRPRALRGRLHGRDRPRRHPVGRPGPVRGRPGARHAARQRRCAASCSPGDAGHRPADRQRDDRHGQGHLAARRRCPVIVELFYQSYQFGQRSFQIMPGIVAATIWYLIVCSILMVGQSRLERYYGRGFGAVPQKTQQKLTKIGADH